MKRLRHPSLAALLLALSAACVTAGTHEQVLAELDDTRKKLTETQQECENTRKNLSDERDAIAKQNADCALNLTNSREQNVQLVAQVTEMGANVEQLLEQKGQLSEERKALAKQIEDLRRMREAAEARNAEYKSLLSKLSTMIDAGTLEVKIRNGSMLVQMSSDVVFPPGGTHIKRDAGTAITELAKTIAQFEGRRFQVVGHSDPTPINTSRFPSNWELSSQRAIEVVKLLIDAGVPPAMLSAAGAAEFDPLVENDTPENRAINRRVEIVFLPKIDELPGFGPTAALDDSMRQYEAAASSAPKSAASREP